MGGHSARRWLRACPTNYSVIVRHGVAGPLFVAGTDRSRRAALIFWRTFWNPWRAGPYYSCGDATRGGGDEQGTTGTSAGHPGPDGAPDAGRHGSAARLRDRPADRAGQ